MTTQAELLLSAQYDQIVKATEALTKLAAQADKAQGKADDLGKTSSKSSKEVGGLGDAFKQLGGPLGEASNRFDEIKDRLGGATTLARGFGLALAGIAVAAAAVAVGAIAVAKLALAVADAADKLNDLANRSNISTERLSLLDAAAKMAGSSVEELVSSSEALGQKLARQADGTGKVSTALKELGINTKDANGNTKSMLQLQEEIVLVADSAANKTEAESAAVRLLGNEYYKIRTAVKETFKAKSEMYDYMSKTGQIVSTSLAKASDDLNDKIGRLGGAFKGMANSIGTVVIPVLSKIVDWMVVIFEKAAEFIRRFTGNSTATEAAEKQISDIETRLARAEKARAGYDKNASGAIVERNRALIEQLQGQLDAAQTDLRFAKRVNEQAKKEATDGKPGEGNRVTGRDVPDTAAADKIKALMATLAGLRARELDEADKLSGKYSEQNALKAKLTEITDQLTGRDKARAQLLAAEILQLNSANEVEKARVALEKQVTAEKIAQSRLMANLTGNAEKQLAAQEEEFANRYASPAKRAADRANAAIASPFNSVIAGKEGELGATTDPRRVADLQAEIAQVKAQRDAALAKQNIFNNKAAGTPEATANALGSMGISIENTKLETDLKLAEQQRYYDGINELEANYRITAEEATGFRQQLAVRETQERLKTASTLFGSLATLQQSSNKRLAAIGKAAAIADATMNAYVAINAALAKNDYAGAIAVGVMAFANVAKIAGVSGFKEGGYTGGGGRSEPAGIVHGKEFVVNASATAKHRGMLEMINRGYQMGGYVEPLRAGAGTSIGMATNRGSSSSSNVPTQINNITVSPPSGNAAEDRKQAKMVSDLMEVKWLEMNGRARQSGGVNNPVTLQF